MPMVNDEPKRVVSLIASATEIVCALGARDRLVGRSHECDFPEDVTLLPVLTSPKFPVNGSSYEIDQRVKAILQEGLSVYRVDAEKLKALRPHVIVTQDHCEACAVSLKDVELALCDWSGSAAKIVSLRPDRLADIWQDIRQVARALGRESKGESVVAELRARMQAIAEVSATARYRPRVASIEWIDPLMAGGNWMPELVELAGGENLFGQAGQHSPWSNGTLLLRWIQTHVVHPWLDIPHTSGHAAACHRLGWRDLKAARGPRRRRRWQSLFQPPRPAHRREPRDPCRDPSPRIVRRSL
jgi:iron complex transport system substrate-binding protein